MVCVGVRPPGIVWAVWSVALALGFLFGGHVPLCAAGQNNLALHKPACSFVGGER